MYPQDAAILLVEDSPDDLELTMRALRRGAVPPRIEVARDGVEALDYLARAEAPLVVLLDVKLPRLDGIETLRRIKDDPRTRGVPVVMLTSSAEDTDLATCYQLGANSYVVKPLDIQRYFQWIAELGEYWTLLNRTERTARTDVAGR